MADKNSMDSCTILLVEGGQANRNIVEAYLQPDNYKFLFAAGFDDALQILECNPVDLVIVDMVLPDRDGFELCEKIRETDHICTVPVLMITSMEGPDERKRGFDAGVDDFLTKPINKDELRARVRTITRLNHYRTLHETHDRLQENRIELTRLQNFDSVTGLANISTFRHALEKELARARRSEYSIAVTVICANEYDQILGVYGESAAGYTACEIADRLTHATRGRGMVGRLDGRSFIAFQPIPREDELLSAVQAYRKSLRQPFQIKDEELNISSSIGASVFPSDADDAEKLISLAVSAMTHASKMGRNRYHVYAPAARADVKRQLRLEAQIIRSLEEEDLELHYQPRIRLDDGRVVAVEGLLRMRNGRGGYIPPNIFLPVAKDCGLMHRLGVWAINQASEDAANLMATGHVSTHVSVNVSGDELRHPKFITEFRHAMAKAGIGGKLLELEITESALVPQPDFDLRALTTLLSAIRAEGCRVAIDDFGTGYSSLNYLRHFPLDAIKIDCSFIREIPDDPKAAAIARSIIALGQNLNMKVIAEGVETDRQLRFLRQAECDEVQGFLYARPVPFSQLPETLKQLEYDWSGQHEILKPEELQHQHDQREDSAA